MTPTFAWWATALAVALVPTLAHAQQPERPLERQIADAVSPLPDSLRPGAQVLGYRDGRLVELRGATNAMICLADDPAVEGFHTACYHRSLEPFMARGRALKAQGLPAPAADSVRLAEAEAGRIPLPQQPAALYSLFHDDNAFDPAGGNAEGLRGLYVIYMPYATQESTGISTTPSRTQPWLMNPGTPTAHVMINRR